ncbi:MAG: putative metal-binding motif-containing protein [Myxococcota bacterium]
MHRSTLALFTGLFAASACSPSEVDRAPGASSSLDADLATSASDARSASTDAGADASDDGAATDAAASDAATSDAASDTAIIGTGFAYLVVDPVEVDFGIRPVDDVQTVDLDLENAGNRALHVSRVAFVGVDGQGATDAFGVNRSGAFTVEPGAHAAMKLTFYVLAEEPFQDVMLIESDSAGGPLEVHVSGGGIVYECVDLDGDEHGPYCDAGLDCDQADRDVHADAPERCNGQDDDCDGLTDEDWIGLGASCTTAHGVCQSVGFRVCNDGGDGLVCKTNPVTGGDELCNGLDDDCDGATDEDFPELGKLCQSGLGECARFDKWVCSADRTGVACNVDPGAPGPEVDGNGKDDDCDGKTDERPDLAVGCADGEREGFVDLEAWPDIAACSGAWSIGGVVTDQLFPTCARQGGDDGPRLDGSGCNVADLCAEGWHVCTSSADVASHSPTGCDGAAPGESAFFVTRQSGTGCAQCATGEQTGGECNSPYSCISGCAPNVNLSNDVFGCGSLGSPPNPSCAPLDMFSHNNCSALTAPWACSGSTVEAANIAKSGPEHGGAVCCRDR